MIRKIFKNLCLFKQIIAYLIAHKKVLHPNPVYFSKTKDDVVVEVAIQYNDSYNEQAYSVVNNINTIEGGTHLAGFRSALTRVSNDYINKPINNMELLAKVRSFLEG